MVIKRAIHRCSNLEFLEHGKEKPFVNMSWSKWIGSGRIPKNSKSKTPSADSNLGPRCEGSGRTKNLPTLGPRVEARYETRNPQCGGGRGKGGRNSATLNLVS
ncbi:hypothetical protein AVEN_19413-1 [Araneus ventricosus]|uniref:Uncharacterized protein n=1 Tax=Araneus ventricosus TaxID=182803 RepID=A0A4Y2C640_ARAVE|nr:hypothetical protein AVEN_19413-1 [Araneus ventricosus]